MNGQEAERRENPMVVMSMALGLLFILSAGLLLFSLRGGTLDGEALLRERFQLASLPAGFEIVEAVSLPAGEEMVVLGDPSVDVPAFTPPTATSGAEQGREPPSGEAATQELGWDGKPKFDWGSLVEGVAGTRPAELIFIWYPRSQAEGVLARQFGRLDYRDLKNIRWDGGRAVIESGRLDWDVYQTHFVRERTFDREEGVPTYRDAVRVNLTVGGRCCVMYALWPRGVPGAIEPVKDILATIEP